MSKKGTEINFTYMLGSATLTAFYLCAEKPQCMPTAMQMRGHIAFYAHI